MTIPSTVVGSYPKPPDEGTAFTVRKTLHALERGEATVDDLYAAHDDLVRQVIKEQEEAGIDIVSDGMARWDDLPDARLDWERVTDQYARLFRRLADRSPG